MRYVDSLFDTSVLIHERDSSCLLTHLHNIGLYKGQLVCEQSRLRNRDCMGMLANLSNFRSLQADSTDSPVNDGLAGQRKRVSIGLELAADWFSSCLSTFCS